jgi:hypothetical protein
LPEKYREILVLYDRGSQIGELGYYPILQHEACFKIANILLEIQYASFTPSFVNGASVAIWSEQKSIGAELVNAARSVGEKVQNKPEVIQSDEVQTASPISTRLAILSWASKAFLTGIEFLKLKDQLITISRIASICNQLSFHRKHAFYLRLAGLCIQALTLSKQNLLKTAPALKCLFASFELNVGSSIQGIFFENIDSAQSIEPWMDDDNKLPVGWAFLQVHILREAIEMAEVNHINNLYSLI